MISIRNYNDQKVGCGYIKIDQKVGCGFYQKVGYIVIDNRVIDNYSYSINSVRKMLTDNKNRYIKIVPKWTIKIKELDIMEYKICSKCKRELPISHFHKDKSKKDGYRADCKECRKPITKKYYNENTEKCIKTSSEWIKENKDRYNELRKQWLQSENGLLYKFNGHNKRRSNEENQGNGINKEQWMEMMEFFEWKCAYSGISLTKDNRSIDHIIPLHKNGENEVWNCVPMYQPYNSSKHINDMEEWYRKQEYFSEENLKKIYQWIEYAKDKWS